MAYAPVQILKDTKLCDDFPIVTLAELTDGLSGSDLKELSRNAAMLPMREMLREVGEDAAELSRLHKEVCPISRLVHFGASLTLPIRDLS